MLIEISISGLKNAKKTLKSIEKTLTSIENHCKTNNKNMKSIDKNIEKISDSLNFKKLDVYIVNKDLSSPYKIDSELVEIEILGTLGK